MLSSTKFTDVNIFYAQLASAQYKNVYILRE